MRSGCSDGGEDKEGEGVGGWAGSKLCVFVKSLRKSVKQVNFGQLAFQFVRDVQVEKLSLSDLD